MKQTRIYPFGIDAVICTSLLGKMKGMMFSSSGKKPLLFVFDKENKVPIHMLFVFFELIVVWIDSKKRIADFKVMKPFTVYSPKSKSKYVLEIPLTDGKNKKRLLKCLKKGVKVKFRE